MTAFPANAKSTDYFKTNLIATLQSFSQLGAGRDAYGRSHCGSVIYFANAFWQYVSLRRKHFWRTIWRNHFDFNFHHTRLLRLQVLSLDKTKTFLARAAVSSYHISFCGINADSFAHRFKLHICLRGCSKRNVAKRDEPSFRDRETDFGNSANLGKRDSLIAFDNRRKKFEELA